MLVTALEELKCLLNILLKVNTDWTMWHKSDILPILGVDTLIYSARRFTLGDTPRIGSISYTYTMLRLFCSEPT